MSSANKLNMANQALLLLGESPLASLDENRKTAKAVNIYWDTSYRSCLSAHRWHFAKKRQLLQPLVRDEQNDWQWDNKFRLPNDFLKVIKIESDTVLAPDEWEREGRNILANASQVLLQYIYNCPIGEIDATFEQAVVGQLAYQMSYFLTGSTAKGRDMFAIYKDRLDEARTEHGLEQIFQQTEVSQLARVR